MSLRPALLVMLLSAFAVPLVTCDGSAPVGTPSTVLAVGTWGGEDAGVIVEANLAHVHVGCTYGDFPAPIALDDEGRFSVAGEHQPRAEPVETGPPMPARFGGVVRGDELTLSVAVNDTIADELVLLGPVTVVLGREPEMGPCPICDRPAEG